MYPILGRLPNILVYSYTIVWGGSLLFTALWLYQRSKQEKQLKGWFDMLLAAICGALIGGRLSFLLLNQAYFAEQPNEVWLLFNGGFGYYGALYGAGISLIFWCRFNNRPLHLILPMLSSAITGLYAAGWLACLLEGCAYGTATYISWYAAELPDSFGVYAVRYQTQLVGILSALIWLSILPWLQNRVRRFWATIAYLNLIYGLITLIRADSINLLFGWRLDTILAIATTLIALLAAFVTTSYQHVSERPS